LNLSLEVAILQILDIFINNRRLIVVEKYQMEKLVLDKVDLKILVTLSRDCRTPYSRLGSLVGLTSKSVKARVKTMLSSGVLDKFIVRVNPAIFGYGTAPILIRINKRITKDEVIRRVKRIGDIAYHVHHVGRTSVAALIIKESLDDKIIQSLTTSLRPASINRIFVSEQQVSSSASETDLRIIKCLLLSGARTEISDIAKKVRISEKTTTRRLDKMKEGNLIEFSIQCEPALMVGYTQFTILISVEKSHYRSVHEQMYMKFQENVLYHPSTLDPDDLLIFVLFGENVSLIDFILSTVDSFEGVRNTYAYILTKWQYHDDWIIREIDERLCRTVLPKSIQTNHQMD
jgi:DNA-binding Lrp family transcriptional regulator